MKIGILGGGQLGRMFLQEALKYDDEFFILDPNPECSCKGIAEYVQGDFYDFDAVLQFGKDKEVLTVEIEHVSVPALEELQKQGVKVIPKPGIIKIIQQKILQKEFYEKHQIPSPGFKIWRKGSQKSGFHFPFVQKLNSGGYDGKGVQIIRNEAEMQHFWEEDSVIEELVEIEKELSIIIAYNERGETKTFPITEMVADPELNLLDFNLCPARISEEVEKQAEEIAQQFIESVQSPGLFAIELFLDKRGKVWVNETAPRLHNSGHQSQEGNYNSQFEQFYRVLKNYPLANTELRGVSGMLNLVGEPGFSGEVVYEGLENALQDSSAFIHLYGKKETRAGRKMGHINVIGKTHKEVLEKLMHIKSKVRVVSGKQ